MKRIRFFCSISPAIFIAYSSCSGALLVHFIDVGQGEYILIQMPVDKNVLADTGNFSVGHKIAILSVGQNNRYGYPSDAVIQRFVSRKIPLFRTDFNRTIVIQKDGEIISIEKERE